jgi:hypothetical protein
MPHGRSHTVRPFDEWWTRSGSLLMEPSRSLATELLFVSLLIPVLIRKRALIRTTPPLSCCPLAPWGTSLHPWPSLGRLSAHAVGWNYSLDDLSLIYLWFGKVPSYEAPRLLDDAPLVRLLAPHGIALPSPRDLSLVKVGCFLIYRGDLKFISGKSVYSSSIAVSAVPFAKVSGIP